MKIDEFQDILYEKEPETGMVTITFNQPQRKNALSLITFLELSSALETMEKDPEARILILTGRGEAFSSGGYFNLNFMQSLTPEQLSQIDVTDRNSPAPTCCPACSDFKRPRNCYFSPKRFRPPGHWNWGWSTGSSPETDCCPSSGKKPGNWSRPRGLPWPCAWPSRLSINR